MISKNYLMWCEKPEAGPIVVSAHSPGQAVEFFCSNLGVISYGIIKVHEIDSFSLAEVCRIVPTQVCPILDEHHKWSTVEFPMFPSRVVNVKVVETRKEME